MRNRRFIRIGATDARGADTTSRDTTHGVAYSVQLKNRHNDPAMPSRLSPRLLKIVEALPLRDGISVLEIGCGPGAMAREMASRVGRGRVLGIDRSDRAIAQAEAGSVEQIRSGTLRFVRVAVEDFVLNPDEARFDLAVAVRVGVLDGRYPDREREALRRIADALVPGSKLYIDGGDGLVNKPLQTDQYRGRS